jgi:hypothetical protein
MEKKWAPVVAGALAAGLIGSFGAPAQAGSPAASDAKNQRRPPRNVKVVNAAPIPVAEPSLSARLVFSKWVNIPLEGKAYHSVPLVRVPKGYRLVIDNINVDACSPPEEEMTANLTFWPRDYEVANPDEPPPDDIVPKIKIVLQPQGVFFKYRHFGANQTGLVYANEGQLIWAEAYRTGDRAGDAEARVWVSGYFLPAVQTPGVQYTDR